MYITGMVRKWSEDWYWTHLIWLSFSASLKCDEWMELEPVLLRPLVQKINGAPEKNSYWQLFNLEFRSLFTLKEHSTSLFDDIFLTILYTLIVRKFYIIVADVHVLFDKTLLHVNILRTYAKITDNSPLMILQFNISQNKQNT